MKYLLSVLLIRDVNFNMYAFAQKYFLLQYLYMTVIICCQMNFFLFE